MNIKMISGMVIGHFFFSFCLNAQSLIGITNQKDTSYSTYSAYQSTKKTHPEIQIVAEFKGLNIREKRNVEFLNWSKRPLLLDAFWPTEKNTNTAIVIVHGGGWRSGNRQQHIPLAQKLASMGYACFTVEYRLSTEALFPAAVQDVKAAIKWVKENRRTFNVDSSKVVVLGFSAGGQLAALVGATNNVAFFDSKNSDNTVSSNVSAIVDLDGILAFIHPESGEGDDSKRTSAATYWFGYSKTENPTLWQKGSALAYASMKTPPTLFINSSVERMHAGRNDFIEILNKHKIYSEVVSLNNAPHSFVLFEPWFSPMIKTIDDFLKKIETHKRK
jgi:acetyl esterase/lipase